jgi:hypothetical protein
VIARSLLIGILLASSLAAQEDKRTAKVELKALWKVDGISFKQGQSTKYSGDTYLLILAFTDADGAPWQPTPTLNFNVYNGQEPYKKVQRIVTKEGWKADREKINQQTVADNTIASDKKTGDLWVAFVRADPGFDTRFDLTLEVKGTGTWTWKGVNSETEYKAAAKGPDKKEKK